MLPVRKLGACRGVRDGMPDEDSPSLKGFHTSKTVRQSLLYAVHLRQIGPVSGHDKSVTRERPHGRAPYVQAPPHFKRVVH